MRINGDKAKDYQVKICHHSSQLAGWVYCHIYNAMQYSNTALETTALVMHDSNTFFYGVPPFLMAL